MSDSVFSVKWVSFKEEQRLDCIDATSPVPLALLFWPTRPAAVDRTLLLDNRGLMEEE